MMSLYIKMLEDERRVLEGRALLPRLHDNIKCGNSLVGYDIDELDDAERARVNPFDWNSKSDVARERIEREIKVTDEHIDTLVYELYGLTEEEIKIVET